MKTNIPKTTTLLFLCAWSLSPTLSAKEPPVQVYILSGQSNMVGIGQVDGRGSHWRGLVSEPVVSVYPGDYDASADYDAMTPTQTLAVENFGNNSAFPGEGTHVLRGFVTVKETGIYEIRPGYGNSELNIAYIGGQEIHRKEPGQEKAVNKPIKLEAGKKTPLKIIYLKKTSCV